MGQYGSAHRLLDQIHVNLPVMVVSPCDFFSLSRTLNRIHIYTQVLSYLPFCTRAFASCSQSIN
jgi:hypothetical protein